MKKITFALFSAALLMSCSKDSDDISLQTPSGNSNKIKKVEEI